MAKKTETLRQYLKRTGRSVTFYAKHMGVSRQTMSGYVHGHTLPDLALAVRIEEDTGGCVTPRMFLNPQETPRGRPTQEG